MFFFLILVFGLGTIFLLREAVCLTRKGQKGRSLYLLAFTCASTCLIFIQMAIVTSLLPEGATFSQIPSSWISRIIWTAAVMLFSLVLGVLILILDDVKYGILGKDKPVSR